MLVIQTVCIKGWVTGISGTPEVWVLGANVDNH